MTLRNRNNKTTQCPRPAHNAIGETLLRNKLPFAAIQEAVSNDYLSLLKYFIKLFSYVGVAANLLPPWVDKSFCRRGGVSRMKRMDSSFQCCIKDGSRPTTYGVQTEYVNHLKVLCSKDILCNQLRYIWQHSCVTHLY